MTEREGAVVRVHACRKRRIPDVPAVDNRYSLPQWRVSGQFSPRGFVLRMKINEHNLLSSRLENEEPLGGINLLACHLEFEYPRGSRRETTWPRLEISCDASSPVRSTDRRKIRIKSERSSRWRACCEGDLRLLGKRTRWLKLFDGSFISGRAKGRILEFGECLRSKIQESSIAPRGKSSEGLGLDAVIVVINVGDF